MAKGLQKTATKTALGLNLRQEEFCRLFVGGDRDFFGNGTGCYIEIYQPKRIGNWYNGAKASASRELTKVNVIRRINELLDVEGFNEQNVDKQHLFLLNQFADFKSKLGAVKEFNALKKRIAPIDAGIRTVIINFNGIKNQHQPDGEAMGSIPSTAEPID